jgi:hypothetical protein
MQSTYACLMCHVCVDGHVMQEILFPTPLPKNNLDHGDINCPDLGNHIVWMGNEW